MATSGAKHSKLDRVDINQGLSVIHDPKVSPKDAIDIISIPGLGADPTWTWKKDNVHWLQDQSMLRSAVPNARIMVYEYTSQWYGSGAVNARLQLVGEGLVRALREKRRERTSKWRPVVFVCHCLGGLVAAKAICVAKARQEDFPLIFPTVIGCIFLGTPFRGTKSQAKASFVANIVSMAGAGQDSSLLKMLEPGSEKLVELGDEFFRIAKQSNLEGFCFFEQQPSDLGKMLGSIGLHHMVCTHVDPPIVDFLLRSKSAGNCGNRRFCVPANIRQVCSRLQPFSAQ